MTFKKLIISLVVIGVSVSLGFLVQAKTVEVTQSPSRLSVPTCGTPIIDRDGFVYNTVEIGKQCWMAENLKTKTKPDGTCINQVTGLNKIKNQVSSKFFKNLSPCGVASSSDNGKGHSCFNNIEANCTSEGALYTWDAAMNGSTTEGAQGICPDGWHVPTYIEQYQLFYDFSAPQNYYNCAWINPEHPYGRLDCAPAGTALKVGGISGFNGKLSGVRNVDGVTFEAINSQGYFMSSLQDPDYNFAFAYFFLDAKRQEVGRLLDEKTLATSLRCVKN